MSNCEKSTLYIICLLIFIASCFYVYYTIIKNREIKKIDKIKKDENLEIKEYNKLNEQYNEKPLKLFKNMFEYPDPWRNGMEIAMSNLNNEYN